MPKVLVTADITGRLRVSKAQRRDILAALARSGETVTVKEPLMNKSPQSGRF